MKPHLRFNRELLALLSLAALCGLLLSALSARALEPVQVSRDAPAIDLTAAAEIHHQESDSLNVSTAPDRDGIVRRVEVRAKNPQAVTHWAVFALVNNTNEQLDRLIVAPHYRLVGSGIFWPDLDSSRIATITPSEGFSLEPADDREADSFLVTLDPGAVVTFVAELRSPTLPRLYLWDPDAYKDTVNSYTLYRGIVLGISGLLAVFLTILFVVKGTAVFPATAALAWGVLAYVCVDFGFWDRILAINTASLPVWRAGTEVFLAATLIIFIYTYLNLNRWHSHFSTVALGWLLSLIILLGVAVALPDIAAGIARVSFGATGIAGAGLIVYMSLHRYDKAVMLIPTWILMVAWLFGAWLTVTGRLSNDIIQPALAGGLVLLVMLLGFTVMQHAFAGGALAQGLVSDAERQALALTGAGYTIWDWDATRDFIHTGPEAALALGLDERALNGPVKNWINLLHPNDRDRFRATLDAIAEHKRGRVAQTFRLRSESGQYHWFDLRGRPLLGMDGEVIRCVGTVVDVTDVKNAEERLLFDSVHDNLTGLENRQLLVGRLDTAISLTRRNAAARPSIFHVNIDHFREINAKLGFGVGDTILLTVARRLMRLLRDGDSLARLGGDQFAILLVSETTPDKIAAFADSIRRSLKAPIQFAGQQIELTASIGIATWTAEHRDAAGLMRDAELAMLHARRFGGNRIEPFRPAFRSGKDETTVLIEELREAIKRGQISVLYQPIVRLADRSIAGFEALIRWQHPRLGNVSPADFIPAAEGSGLINGIGRHVLDTAARDIRKIAEASGNPGLFVSVNISSREILRHDIVADIAGVLKRSTLPASMLRIELTESLVMENPEGAIEVLNRIRALGVGLSMDDFGTGYSSLAYVMRFPFDTIKIDQSFVLAREKKERLVVLRAIAAMAHGLGKRLIAEGIEFESDVTDLLQLGCECGQGYLFGEAMDQHEAAQMVSQEYRLAGQ
ncbi:MAG: diguanylate cyclase [Alphaproteobacteria bacterium]|nr:MAG: diguanylate cyclase [Alphaproteobacteria bacterium]